VTSTQQDGAQQPPTLFAWAGGAEAFSRLTRIFYGHVSDDPILAPVFTEMSPSIPNGSRSGWGRCSVGRRPTPTSVAATRTCCRATWVGR
jgi:hypothetical protein